MKKIKTWDFVLTKDIQLDGDNIWPLFMIIGVDKRDLQKGKVVYTALPIHMNENIELCFDLAKIHSSDIASVVGYGNSFMIDSYESSIQYIFNAFLGISPENLIKANISFSDLIPLESKDAILTVFKSIMSKKDNFGNVDLKYIQKHFLDIEDLSYREDIDKETATECYNIIKALENSFGGINAFSELVNIPKMTIMRVHSNLTKWINMKEENI